MPNHLLLSLPTAHRESSPQLPVSLKPQQQLLRHCSQHCSAHLGPAHEAGTQGGSCGCMATSWDRFPPQVSSETCPSEAQACSSCGLLCKSPRAGVHCMNIAATSNSFSCKPPSCPWGAPATGKGTEGRWQGQTTTPAARVAPSRADMQRVTGQCCSMSGRAVGTTSHLHRAGREPAAAAGLPGHAGDPQCQHCSRTHIYGVLSVLPTVGHLRL